MLFSIYFSPLHIVHCSIVLYEQLTVTENLYSLSFREGWGEVCSLSFLKPHGDVTGTESGNEAGRIVNRADAGIGIGGVESFVEEDYTVVAVEHQIAGMNRAGLVCSGGKRGGQVMVFLIAVQFVHRHGKGQKGSKSFACFGVCQRGSKGL